VKLRSILFFNISVSLFSLASLLVTIANNDPFSSSFQTFLIFYLSFFVFIWSITTLLIFLIKSRIYNNQLLLGSYFPTVRQSFFVSVTLTIILLLYGLEIFDWWIGVSVIVSFLLLELFFETKYRQLKLNKERQ
jgi:hypothetical protein